MPALKFGANSRLPEIKTMCKEHLHKGQAEKRLKMIKYSLWNEITKVCLESPVLASKVNSSVNNRANFCTNQLLILKFKDRDACTYSEVYK